MSPRSTDLWTLQCESSQLSDLPQATELENPNQQLALAHSAIDFHNQNKLGESQTATLCVLLW